MESIFKKESNPDDDIRDWKGKKLEANKNFDEVKNCYLRAIELLDMTVGDQKWKNGWKELLRFKELLGKAYSYEFTDLSFCLSYV